MATEKRLIDANALIDRLKFKWKVSEFGLHRGLESAIAQCDKAPTVDAVSRGVHEQVRWERDVAIEQLESYGVSLGEKADVVKVVRCKDCKHFIQGEPYDPCECMKWKVKWGAVYTTQDGYCHKGERRGK